jgi:hypothetical protein
MSKHKSNFDCSNSGLVSCLGSSPCPDDQSKLKCHIFPLSTHLWSIEYIFFLFLFDEYEFYTPSFLVVTNLLLHLIILELYNLHINCGGDVVNMKGSPAYDADTDPGGPSKFYRSPQNWGFSSTGDIMDNGQTDLFIVQNSSSLSMTNPELYMKARISPLSLTYYAFCLGNGNYTVSLHFAEIMFTNNKSYSSLGRRIFDIYIQVIITIYFHFHLLKQLVA